ncbi:MAG: recombinase family protein [Pyramidobacter sp.]
MDKTEIRKLNAEFGKIPLEQRAVIYARYSTQNQTADSIEHQYEECYEYARKNGLTIVKEYKDEAQSGTQTLTRDSYNRMLEDSADHVFSKVIVFRFDRFSRNLRGFLNDEHRLNQNGVKIISTIEITPEGISGKLIKYILMIAAELYAESVSGHTSAATYSNAAKGNYNGGKVPYGYKVVAEGDRKKLVIDEEEAAIILEIFKLYAEGQSYSELAEHLDQIGARNKNGLRFKEGSFNSIFNNTIYGGEYGYGKGTDKAIVTKMPELQIVPDDLLEKVRQRISENKSLAGRKRGKRFYPLSGKVKCRKCRRNMQIKPSTRRKNGKKYDYTSYVCPNVKQKSADGSGMMCKCKGVILKDLENYVMDKIIRGLFGNASLKDVTRRLNEYILAQAKDSKQALDEQRKLLKKHKDSLQRLKMQKEDGKDGLNWDNQLARVKENILKTRENIRKLKLRRKGMTCTAKDVIQLIMLIKSEDIKRLDVPEIHEFIDAYLEKVTVSNKYIRVTTKLNELVDEDDEYAEAAD